LGGETGEDPGFWKREIDYIPLPSQERFHDSKARFKGFSGPIGSGKSQALCWEAIRLAYLNPGRTGLIGAPTYPTDVNQTAFNRAINFPQSAWTPAALACLKTECFGFTNGRNLDQSLSTIHFGGSLGFTPQQRSQLVGIGDAITAWDKEARAALGQGLESVVLFALDQFCLIGYGLPLPQGLRRSLRMSR
jgi:hypothetical protein